MSNRNEALNIKVARAIFYIMSDKFTELQEFLNEESDNEKLFDSLNNQMDLGIKNATTKAERAERELDLFTRALDVIDEIQPVQELEEIRDLINLTTGDEGVKLVVSAGEDTNEAL